MSLQGRMEQLTRRHAELEDKIHSEQKRPAADTVKVQKLKKEKLRLKEELTTLRAS